MVRLAFLISVQGDEFTILRSNNNTLTTTAAYRLHYRLFITITTAELCPRSPHRSQHTKNTEPASVTFGTVIYSYMERACRTCEINQVTLDDIEDSGTLLINQVVGKKQSHKVPETMANFPQLKKHGGWNSSTVAERYVDESVAHRTEIADKVFRTCGSAEITPDLRPSTSTGVVMAEKHIY
ncbi:unnamed protein product [Acanthoscelides obtectus]|uniref:Tyr recombinase domain-containing protein n=1 Tax=Acanthoscelides obtectus TaxID=200917 RepID=A0A9P0MEH5_ACAOB|nr:unnamed protein product [Acanthoscelides obtectus]CAK1626837.1 hypothetical protein AOBTE_LOCUS4105 [Acanthoscelides obtectus]